MLLNSDSAETFIVDEGVSKMTCLLMKFGLQIYFKKILKLTIYAFKVLNKTEKRFTVVQFRQQFRFVQKCQYALRPFPNKTKLLPTFLYRRMLLQIKV